MSGLLSLLLVSVSVGLSNFAGAIAIGMGGIDTRTRIRVGVTFGVFEGLMPVVGLLLGAAVAGYLGHIAHYVGGGILVLTGAYTIWHGRRPGKPAGEAGPAGMGIHRLLVTGLALSIDNLAVGFAIAIHQVAILPAALMMAFVSVAMSLVGLELGDRLGDRVEKWAEEAGGGLLILVGVALALGLLG